MDEGRRACRSNGRKSSACSTWSSGKHITLGTSAEPRHSTPVKKENGGAPLDANQVFFPSNSEMDRMARQLARSTQPIPTDSPCSPLLQDSQLSVSDMEGATIQRQRRELQLLIAELKDRDRELNTMAAFHHRQLRAWEQDRQKVLTLEQRCARLDDELQKRNEVIRVLTKRVWMVETREKEVQKELGVTQQQLHKLGQKQQHISQKCQDFEEKNQSLNSTVTALSSQVGSLQVREEELSAMLKLKDKDVTEANAHIVDLTGRQRDLETSLKESSSRESRLLRELEENKRRYREARHENTHLKEELQQQVTQSSAQREEIIRLKQEHQLLCRDLVLSGEGDSWKDELLALAGSKQERTQSELHCLRQVCENQQNDLQLLQLNLESARESLREKTSPGSHGSQDDLKCGCLDSLSPFSLRVRNCGTVSDIASLPAASLQGTTSGDLGLFSAAFKDGDRPVSACSLQRLLDESRQVVASLEHATLRPFSCLQDSDTAVRLNRSQDSGAAEPLHCHTCQASPHHHHTPSTHKVSETPPKAQCPDTAPVSHADSFTLT
ncbi:coiled-coil domain-containing protein 62 [Centroberyx gerrardi]